MKETEILLFQWAAWVRAGGAANIGYPSVQAFARWQGCALATPMIKDDTAVMIDGLLSRLRYRDGEMGDVLVTYLLVDGNASATARHCGLCRKRVEALVRAGVCWVDGVLDVLKEAA